MILLIILVKILINLLNVFDCFQKHFFILKITQHLLDFLLNVGYNKNGDFYEYAC